MKQCQKYFLLLTLAIISCTQKIENSEPMYSAVYADSTMPVYSFAVHPLHNPQKLMKEYQPLINFLNSNVKGARFTLEASRNYNSYEEKIKNRKLEFIIPNPYQTLQAIKSKYHVVAMAGESSDFKGIFIVRKDNNAIRIPMDLKGSAVSYPASTALAACIMPQYFLHHSGLNVLSDIKNLYVGSQESAIMNVYIKNTAAGATWPSPWRAFKKDYPQEASELKVIWETEPLINNSVMIRDDIPLDIQIQVQNLLTSLHKTKKGKEILEGIETARFFPASDNDYNVVRIYVDKFEKDVRKIETK